MARPTFKPTAAQKRQVAIAAGGGMSHEEISLALGISRPTLLKHFEFELSTGANHKRLEVMNAMYASAKKGNVAAQKSYIATTPACAAPPAPVAEPKEKPLGKKEQQQVDAQQAGATGEWSELLAPRAPVH